MTLNMDRRLAGVGSLFIGSMIVVACGGGTSSSAGSGNPSNVVGNVATFNSASLTPDLPSGGEKMLTRLGEWFLPAPARAVSGVAVSVAGATTVTQNNGSFAITSVALG